MKNWLLTTGTLVALLAAGCGEKQEEQTKAGNEPPPPMASPAPGQPAPIPAPAPAPRRDTVESLADEFGLQLEQMGRAMKGVKDAASAEKASEIVALVCGEFKSIVARLQKLEVPSDELKEKINEGMEARQAELSQSLGSLEEYMNSLSADARPVVEKAMDDFLTTMNEVHPVMAEYFEVVEESDVAPPPEPLPEESPVSPGDAIAPGGQPDPPEQPPVPPEIPPAGPE